MESAPLDSPTDTPAAPPVRPPIPVPPAVTLAAAGFADLADRAELLLDQLRQAGAGQEVISRLDRLIFTAQVGKQDAENTRAAIEARANGEAS